MPTKRNVLYTYWCIPRAARNLCLLRVFLIMYCGVSSEKIFNGIGKKTNIIFKHLNTDSMNHQIFEWEDIQFFLTCGKLYYSWNRSISILLYAESHSIMIYIYFEI